MNYDLSAIKKDLETDFDFFAESALKVINESAKLVPYRFRPANRILSDARKKMMREVGFVRLLIIKARQLGVSTEIAGMFLHDSIMKDNIATHILSHHSDTTTHLLNIVKTYVENMPSHFLPEIIRDSRKEYEFANGSSYSLGTARSKGSGRGFTCQKFHGSECAFWENEDDIISGITQTVHDVPDTEIMFESTGNGNIGLFFEMCMLSLDGKGDFRLVFLPWPLHPLYTRITNNDFRMTEEELELQRVFKLTAGQILWRRQKVANMGNKLWKFKQEFPLTITEAFQAPSGTFLDADLIAKARKRILRPHEYEHMPMMAGIDVARSRDRTIVEFRQGRKYFPPVRIENGKIPEQAQKAVNLLKERRVEYTFIDYGYAPGFCDTVQKLGYPNVFPILFQGSALNSNRYLNKRAEMGWTFYDALEEDNLDLPDDNSVEKDLLMLKDVNDTLSGKKRLQSKDEVRKDNNNRSCDIFDGIMLTHAMPVCDTRMRQTKTAGSSGIKRICDGSGNPMMRKYRGN